jgi:D-alanine-D-alanine ligase
MSATIPESVLSSLVPSTGLVLPGRGVVGVLTGGVSRERDRSLLSGRTVLDSLTGQGLTARMVDTADARWLQLVGEVDVAFLAIAGQYAEDGKLQGVLETLGVPYTGSGVLASALAMNKPAAKAMVSRHGVPVLAAAPVERGVSAEPCAAGLAAQLAELVGLPLILKPESEGGSIDLAVAHDLAELANLLTTPAAVSQRMLAERFVPGRPVTVGVLDLPTGLTALPALETRPAGREFYDYAAKRDPALRVYHCPPDLPPAVANQLAGHALAAHTALGCAGLSRSDFILTDDGQPYWLELNTLPGLSREGNMAAMAAAAGLTYDQLTSHILATALTHRGYSS